MEIPKDPIQKLREHIQNLDNGSYNLRVESEIGNSYWYGSGFENGERHYILAQYFGRNLSEITQFTEHPIQYKNIKELEKLAKEGLDHLLKQLDKESYITVSKKGDFEIQREVSYSQEEQIPNKQKIKAQFTALKEKLSA